MTGILEVSEDGVTFEPVGFIKTEAKAIVYKPFVSSFTVSANDAGKIFFNNSGVGTVLIITVDPTVLAVGEVFYYQQFNTTVETHITVTSGKVINGVTDGTFQFISQINSKAEFKLTPDGLEVNIVGEIQKQ